MIRLTAASRVRLLLSFGIALGTPGVLAAQNESGHALSEAEARLPQLHHVGLNSADPERAIAWYLKLIPSATRTTVAGYPAVKSDILLLFNKVAGAPKGAYREDLHKSEAQSAFWHIGATLPGATKEDLERNGFVTLPLYVSNQDVAHPVWRSGLAPYAGTKTAEQIRTGGRLEPREGGFSYLVAPDGVLFELTTSSTALPSLAHVHFLHENPICAANWYVRNLGMVLPRTIDSAGKAMTATSFSDDCEVEYGAPSWPSLEPTGTIRQPLGIVRYATGSLNWYPRQCLAGHCDNDERLVPSRGQPLDHVAFTVKNFDEMVDRLHRNRVKFLLEPYAFAETRAVMIEDPDGLAIELIEGPGGTRPRATPPR